MINSRHISFVFTFALLLGACSSRPRTTSEATLPPAQQLTPTSSPSIATVNGEGISAEMFGIHLAHYQAALAQTGTLLATEGINQIVIDDMIDRLLLAQGARAAGFVADEATIDQRLATVVEQAGGQQAFDTWLLAQGYTAESFRQELKLEIEAGHMRAEIAAAVPTTAEQVEARQILLSDEFQAERLLTQLEGGTPFDTILQNNDPQRLGTLGWFPRGYLLQPEVEAAAFALQPGEFSEVIQSELGFHIVEVLDRDANHPLSPQAYLALQLKAVKEWLTGQRAQSTINIQVP